MAEQKRWERRPLEFRREAVERMNQCDNIAVLAQELGVGRSLLYKWRRKLEGETPGVARRTGPRPDPLTRERKLEQELSQVKRVLAEKTLELDFFKGALQRIAVRRRSSSDAIETTSTSKSGK